MSGPCSMCVHFSMEGVDETMKAHGWGVCRLRTTKVGYYQSQAAACQFDPSRFEAQPRTTEALEERAAIIAEGCTVDQNEGMKRALTFHVEPVDNFGDKLPEELDFG